MSQGRTRLLGLEELRFNLQRPLFWVLILLIAIMTWGLSTGGVRIASGDTSVGGREAWITSEFSVAMLLPMLGLLLYGFFIAVACGMSVPRDDESKVQDVIHSTRLTPNEYIFGKFAGGLLTFLIALAIHVVLLGIFFHLVPSEAAEKIRGPYSLANYLRPTLFMVLPTVIFICGASFAVGEWARKPILIFVFPVACFLVCAFFLWSWSPTWLDPQINRLLMWIEPTGFRWINESWIKLDRGIDFYNLQPVPYDAPFLLSRAAFIFLGFAAVGISARHFARGLRGASAKASKKQNQKALAAGIPAASGAARSGFEVEAILPPLRTLGMTCAPPPFLRTVFDVAKFEAQNLRSQPGLYLFVPIILVQVIGETFFRTGAFETPLLLTPGLAAVLSTNTLSILVCLLILFYTVESVLREKNSGLAPISYATPSSTAAMLLGKALANGIVAGVILLAALLGAVIVMIVQKQVALDLFPFLVVWGGLLVPTYLVWSSFVMALLATTGNRYTTYALALGVLILKAWLQFRDKVTWVGNWDLWKAVTWTDFGVGFSSLTPNASALLANRLFWFSLLALFLYWTVSVFPRREHDSTRIVDRLRPRVLGKQFLRILPFLLIPVGLGFWIHNQVLQGAQGKPVERREKEYWGRNFVTWAEAETPHFAGVDLDVTLDPSRRHFRVAGTYRLWNPWSKPLRKLPLSVGDHFEKIEWTLNGEKFEPENRARLYVFKLPTPLAPGDTLTVGFSHEGILPRGFTKNGGGADQFVLEEGIVLTSFGSSFVPVPYFEKGRGIVERENKMDPRDYEEDFFEGITRPAFGGGTLYPVRTKITGPKSFDFHGVGTRVDEKIEGESKTVVYETDHPVNFFNVVGGKWEVKRGKHTEIHHLAKHTYNIDEMIETLDAARTYYSEWFYPYPWKDLRLSEFPGIAGYAQGFPTNITFSEGIGFLTRSNSKARAAFIVTAHEAAHQWWGNILLPGEGPGGDILSEGMAHFSTILLSRQVLGEKARIEFCKRIEERYGDNRQVDSERALVWTDGSKAGDNTVTYDKGGWVFWMLRNLMGDEANSSGIRDFIGYYAVDRDRPMLQDFVRVMRSHAPDSTAFDAFTQQWFFEVAAPEFRFIEAKKEKGPGETWTVRGQLKNSGTGTVDVEVAATRGERFIKQSEEESRRAKAEVSPDYRESKTHVQLGPGEETTIAISCAFDPERVLVDPDAKVLQLKRKSATLALK